jgi:hypothetical protein
MVPEDDGIQTTLSNIITNSTTEINFLKILFTLWYLWKARNDFHFNRRQWKPTQVHHAAQAHLQSHIAALNTQATHVPHHQRTTTLAEASTAGSQVHDDGSQGSTHYQSAHIDLRSPADPGPSTNHHFQDMNLAFADTSQQQMDRCLI